MGRSKMAFHLARLVCPPLLCLLLSVPAQVSGRLDRKHYLVKTEDNDDYIRIKNNDYSGSTVSDQNEAGTDYAGDDYIGVNYARRCLRCDLSRGMRMKCALNGYYYNYYTCF